MPSAAQGRSWLAAHSGPRRTIRKRDVPEISADPGALPHGSTRSANGCSQQHQRLPDAGSVSRVLAHSQQNVGKRNSVEQVMRASRTLAPPPDTVYINSILAIGLAPPSFVMSTDTTLALTARQSEILEFIRHALSTRGVPPTREEIAQAFGFRSLNASEQHLQALHRKGLIELLAGTSRGIRLKSGTQDEIGAAGREFGLPLIGKVAAGSPILAQENVLRHPVIDAALFKPRADYLLEVRGMSMRDAGIL